MDRRNLTLVTLADFLVRTAYQMGKTPLLPIFAASLGASDVLLGTIVSVSTLTGMVTKPLFGFLSDRMGRRIWMAIGVALFAGIPFLYRFVEIPAHLVALRLVHGTATAIFGPVTVAYVAERNPQRRAESLGWFGMARSGGYVVGPALAGGLLLTMAPETVFAVTGLLSGLAFVPLYLMDREGGPPGPRAPGRLSATPWAGRWSEAMRSLRRAGLAVLRVPAIWLAGGLEATIYVATYALKAFLPLYALTAGFTTAQIGLFFALQELAQLLLRPAGGRLGDRLGHLQGVILGMAGLAVALPLLPWSRHPAMLLGLAVLMGAAQALIFPATLALIAGQVARGPLATGVGFAGTLKNGGKVAGPVLGGLLVAGLGYPGMLGLLAGLLGLTAIGLGILARRRTGRAPLPERA